MVETVRSVKFISLEVSKPSSIQVVEVSPLAKARVAMFVICSPFSKILVIEVE